MPPPKPARKQSADTYAPRESSSRRRSKFTTPACSSGGLTGTPTSWRTLIAVTVTTVWAVGFLASVAFPTVVRTELAAGASPIVLTAVAGLFAGDRRR